MFPGEGYRWEGLMSAVSMIGLGMAAMAAMAMLSASLDVSRLNRSRFN